MTKNQIGEPYKRPKRFLMGALIISVMFCAMLPYIAPSIFMEDIMNDYGVGLGLAGMSMSAQLVMSGVCFFIGSFIEDKLGRLKTIKLAMASLLVGVVLSAIAPNIYIFLLARLIAGFGQGLAVGLTAFISTWFADKELSLMMSFNSMGSAIAIAISIAACRPLATALGSWKGALWVYAAVTAVFTVLWFVLGKDSPEGEALEKERAAQIASGVKQQSSLGLAFKESQCWKILVYAAIFTIVNTAIATYLPTYIMSDRGVPAGIATTAFSVQSLFGLVGSLLGGILVTKIWRRKSIMIASLIAYMVCGFAFTFVSSNIVIAALVVLLGFLFYLPLVAQCTVIIETAMAKNPLMISGGMALTSGTGQLLTLIVAPLFQSLTASANMTFAYRVFFASCIIGIVALFFVKETGKKPEVPAEETENL